MKDAPSKVVPKKFAKFIGEYLYCDLAWNLFKTRHQCSSLSVNFAKFLAIPVICETSANDCFRRSEVLPVDLFWYRLTIKFAH